ncbi:MAG: imidazole glycerol phosphate synthase subunit HisF [Desulfovibrionaceae bacterium]|jgi:cyclase|nr:imidazole glycerol phosphate synthase subunit HisF [Desulfovibrionaceae bacterium]
MVRKRLITVLTLNNGVLFRTRNFVPDYRYTLNFVDAWSIDEVVLLDISRPGEGDRDLFYEQVARFATDCFVPLTVGGGVRDLDDFTTLLGVGADKVAVNSAVLRDPAFITRAARQYGAQCVVVSVDAKRTADGGYAVCTDFGKTALDLTPEDWARQAADLGAGEILLQSVDRDGMLEGYDIELVRRVSDAVPIPVLACSGAGNWQHFVDAIVDGGAQAACTTNIYHFTETSIFSAKRFLHEAGVEVRMEEDEDDNAR